MSDEPSPSLAAIAEAAAAPQEAPDMTAGNAYDPGAAYDVQNLRDDCPITPLGFLKQRYFFLDFAGQLIELGSEFRKGELMSLFGTKMGWLEDVWTQWKRAPNNAVDEFGKPIFFRDGFSQKVAQQALIFACSNRGLFDPKGKVRGRGAHRGDNGELVFHCGDLVLTGGRKGVRGRALKCESFKPGLVAGYVYPTLPKLPQPTDEPASVNVAKQIYELLCTWNWKRPEIAAHLLLCFLAAAMLGGALRIRPHAWIVGPSGAGKTTLQQFLRDLMGDWGVFTEDATEAGVRQLLDQDTLAVMFDEIEAEADNHEVVMKIVRLARLAYSGASSVRGSSDHQAKQFVARSCFLFSSIHHHELPAQDRNRIAILQLTKFAKDTEKFILPELAKEWGDQLRRRLLEQWPRFEATLQAYQREMLAQGYSGREQDTYGTLLACGDLLLHDNAPEGTQSGRLYSWVKALGTLVDAARTEAEDTSERCVKHLASHRLPSRGSEQQETVARWLQKLVIDIHNGGDGSTARVKLGNHGLRLVHLSNGHEQGQGGMVDAHISVNEKGEPFPTWLAIANKTDKGVQEIFADSMWKGGVWTQSLALVEGAWHNKKSRFNGGPPQGCVLVPLDQLIDCKAAIVEAERTRGQNP